MENLPPKLTPEAFGQMIKGVQPVTIHGAIPKKPGITKQHKDDEPVHEPTNTMLHNPGTVPMKWFSLAPLYFALGPTFNLLRDFSHTLEGKEAQLEAFKVEVNMMPTLDYGGDVIEGVDPEHWNYLRGFLAESGFTKGGQWWLLTENTFEMKHSDGTFEFTVFTPVSRDKGFYSYLDVSDGTIKFYEGAGNPLVEQYAAIYNTSIKGANI